MLHKTLLIGEICTDKTIQCEFTRMSPEANDVPVYKVLSEECTGGMATIVSDNLIKLNHPHETLTDIYSHITKTRLISSGKQICRIDEDKQASLSQFQLDFLKANKFENIVVSDYGKGLLSKEVIDVINQKNTRVFLDPHPNNPIEQYKNVYALKLNEKEVRHFTGMDYVEGSISLQKLLNCNYVFVTLGELGIYCIEANGICHVVPSKATKVTKVQGAGDVVLASLVNDLTQNIHVLTAMENAMNLVADYIQR
jgi:bifunctional ADP-heptose synthase (sugar kinase/adenylyltransferase)